MAEHKNAAESGSPAPLLDAGARPVVRKRALVLAGAGSTGNAWEIGVIAGLLDAGLDVTEADLIVGTSAGSTVAAQVSSMVPPDQLYVQILGEALPPRTGPVGSDRGSDPTRAAENVMQLTSEIIRTAADPDDMRRRLGQAFLERSASSDSRRAEWRATVAARLPSHDWPHRSVLIVAVDADTGEPVVFDRHTGVELVDAVAASTSNGWTYSIGDRRYFNGGYRRNENADLAAGCGQVLVLSPFGGRSRHPLAWRMQLSAQVDELRADGSTVETIFPDGDSEHMFGANAMDLSLRAPAARAGHSQGQTLAGRLTEFWH